MVSDNEQNEIDEINEDIFNPPDVDEVEDASDPIAENYYPTEYSITS